VIAPILLTILGSIIGVGSTTTNNEGGAGFVGDHLFNLDRIINPEVTLRVWEKTWHGSQLWGIMAPYVVAISGLLIGGYLQIRSPRMLMERRAIFAIIAL